MITVLGGYALGLCILGGASAVGRKTKEAYKNYTWRKDTEEFYAYQKARKEKSGAAL